jgi:hypothetical protein
LQEIKMTRQARKSLAHYLDKFVPLIGVSHCDVIDYIVTVPMRYAEVRARLSNGTTARLANSRQFLGWNGYGSNPTLLFNCGDQRIVLDTGSEQKPSSDVFIAPDGGLVPSLSAA